MPNLDDVLKQQLERLLAPRQNVTTGAANPTLRVSTEQAVPMPTAESVMRNQRALEILETPIETPRTQPGQIAPVDAQMVTALANIGKKIAAHRRQKKADAQSRQLLAQELASSQNANPSGGLEALVPPSLRGVKPMEGPGEKTAKKAQQAGVDQYLGASGVSDRDIAALMDPLAGPLAARRLFPPQGQPFSLGPGEVRYDAKGREVAKSPYEARSSTNPMPAELATFKGMTDGLSPEDVDQARRIALGLASRAGQGRIVDVGGVPSFVAMGEDGQPLSIPLSTLAGEANAAATKEGAKVEAKTLAGKRAEAAADFPRAEQTANQMIGTVESLLQHPGFDALFGKSAMFKPWLIPGTDAADAKALLDQVRGGAFLQAYGQLKGGGQITEVEGAKAEAALARLSQAQSEEAARLALHDFTGAIRGGLDRARNQAGGEAASPALPGGWKVVVK